MIKRAAALAATFLVLSGCGAVPAPGPVARRPVATGKSLAKGVGAAPASVRAVPQADGSRFVAYAAAGAGDGAADLRVITFNTAVGNPKIKTDQAHFPRLPFYAAALEGRDDAAILCLQEVGNAQREVVARLGKGSSAFAWRYQRVGLRQGNMIVVPRRYEIERYDDPHFGWVQVKAAGKAVLRWIGPEGRPNVSQLIEPRGFQIAWLRDTRTGRRFVLVNTHLSFQRGIQEPQAEKLFDHAFRAADGGPLIVAGDLNVRTADTDPGTEPSHAAVRARFRDLIDMGPGGRPPGKTNIDWVLARGFEPVSSRWYTGDSISLPGSPDAASVSDHYAEEDVMRWR